VKHGGKRRTKIAKIFLVPEWSVKHKPCLQNLPSLQLLDRCGLPQPPPPPDPPPGIVKQGPDPLAVPTGRRQGGRMRLVAEDPRDPSGVQGSI